MKVPSIIVLPVLALGLGLVGHPTAAHTIKETESLLGKREQYMQPFDRKASGFTLRDADGNTVSLDGLRDRVVVLWFVYTHCPDHCPLHSEALAEVQRHVNQTPMRDLVTFVTITTDPARDDASRLRAYGSQHGLDPANWVFLTSGAEQPDLTRKVAGDYGLKFTRVEGDLQMHGVVTHLIDRKGQLRAKYHGLKFDPVNMVLHINALTHGDHPKSH